MWMNDVEMAIDAYRVWMQAQIDISARTNMHAGATLEEALEAFDTIFKAGEEDEQDLADVAEALRDYTPGEGISVLELHERMREEGKL